MFSVIGSPDGLLDTNVFIHSLTHDAHSEECQRFLSALEHGRMEAWLEPLVLHELSYVLRLYIKGITRERTARYLLTVLGWPGVLGEKDLMADTVKRWWMTPSLGFVDAFLAAQATRRGAAVYTMNVREFINQGVPVPEPLPST